MIATKPSGRRANHTRNQRRWPTAWVLGVLLGLIVGGGTAWLYPPPSVDMIKVQSAEWYDSMRQLVFSTDTDTGAGNHEPSVYAQDRKSTRLNSSHVAISYAVFCLKKKKHKKDAHTRSES